MAKTKHSFTVGVEAESELGANVIAKAIRITLKGLKFWQDVPCGRNAIGVKKVTVTNKVEK
jgi:hypothetical protein